MQKWVILPVALIAIAFSTPANAQVYGWLTANGDTAPVVIGDPSQITSPIQSTIIHGNTKYGYPFNSGCCEAKSSCCQGIWDGYCGSRPCGGCSPRGASSCRLSKGKGGCSMGGGLFGGFSGCGKGHCGKGGCGTSRCGKGGCGTSSCGKGGCGSGYAAQKGFSTGGCSSCGHGGCQGACGCNACGRRRLGLFDWKLSHGKRCGCSACGGGKRHASHGGGCSSCGGGHIYGSPMQSYSSPIKAHEGETHQAPSVNEVPAPAPTPTLGPEIQPPTVHVEPIPASDRSAYHRFFPNGMTFQPIAF